jgi:hypothetical protein
VLFGCLRAPSGKLRGRELPYLTPLAPSSPQGAMRGRQPLLLPLNVFKHLFEHAIREDLSVNKKDLVRDYFKAAGN